MSSLERGFKSWAERLSGGVRKDLELEPYALLPPESLAEYLDVRLMTPREVDGLQKESLEHLLYGDPWSWSAVTLTTDGQTRVIYNPRRSAGRRASNLMHELAHILLDHEPSRVILSYDGSMVMRTFDARQEEEAGWLAGCLLLPRVALLRAVRAGQTSSLIAEAYGVTPVLANYRIHVCGVDAQVQALARRVGRKRAAPKRPHARESLKSDP